MITVSVLHFPKQHASKILAEEFDRIISEKNMDLILSVLQSPAYALELVITPLLHPVESWNRSTDVTKVFAYTGVFFAIFGILLMRRERESCHGCAKGGRYIRRLGHRDVLHRLVQAGTLDELWDEVQVLCVKEGVKRNNDCQKWAAKRFAGFKNTATEEEFTENVRRVFELGKESVLRQLAGVESIDDVRRICMESQRNAAKYKGDLFDKYSAEDLGLVQKEKVQMEFI